MPLSFARRTLRFLLPIVLWLGYKYVGGQWWVLAHSAILFPPNGPGSITSGYLPSFIVAFIFQFFAYRYRQAWWTRHNYILATALNVGVSLVALATSISQIEGPEWFLNCPSKGKCESPHFGSPGVRDWCHVLETKK